MRIERITTPGFPRHVAGASRSEFFTLMYAEIKATVGPVVEDIRGANPYESVRSGYFVDYQLAGDSVRADIGNEWPFWIFQEDDTDNYSSMPPWREGTRLYEWANRYSYAGSHAAFFLALSIFRNGTKGNHLFETSWRYARDYIDNRLRIAANSYVRSVMGFA